MTLDYSHVVSCLNTEALPEGERGPRLLCIDDDPNISEAFARRLHRYGVEVERAYHGMHGYWLAVTSKPDVIITDLRMPQGEGEYVVQCLKRNAETAHIPVIVLTGIQENGLEEHLRVMGVEHVFSKPVPFDEMLELIGRFVELREPVSSQ